MSVAPLPGPRLEPVRLLRAPACEPPFDDEIDGAAAPIPGQLLLVAGAALLEAVTPAGEPAEEPLCGDEEADGDPTPRAQLPDPRLWAARFAQALAEVLSADRTPRQLMRWTSWPLYQQLEASVGKLTGGRRPMLRSVHVTEPVDGVAEACAVIRLGPRCRAMALRFEGLDGQWRCTAAQLA